MYIKCWGSRGSIPVSGKEYLKYGGDTTCLEIRTKSNDIIIIDAGTGIRRLGNLLIKENQNKYHFIFTHTHWDHIMGFPYFKPLYSNHTEFRMYRCPFHSQLVKNIISNIMAPPNFPVKYSDIKAELFYEEACPTEFEIGSVKVVPIPISHPNGGSGYKFIEDNKSFVFLTDNELGFIHPGGLPYKDYVKFSSGADLLIHDAEYTPEEYKTFIDWGHSVYTDVLNLAFEAGVKKVGLFHLNQERTDREMNKIVKNCGKIIADKSNNMECFAVGCDMTFEL
jgi:phosphoribosyl 1,2-cyclic phosphodiesterase